MFRVCILLLVLALIHSVNANESLFGSRGVSFATPISTELASISAKIKLYNNSALVGTVTKISRLQDNTQTTYAGRNRTALYGMYLGHRLYLTDSTIKYFLQPQVGFIKQSHTQGRTLFGSQLLFGMELQYHAGVEFTINDHLSIESIAGIRTFMANPDYIDQGKASEVTLRGILASSLNIYF